MGNGAQVNERKVNYYRYPPVPSLDKNIRGIYLSNYMFWDPLKQNHSTLEFGFVPERNLYTFDPYERAGSSIYYGIHDILKYERTGYRKSTDHLTRELRHSRILRNQAIQKHEYYVHKEVNIKNFFQWLSVTKTGQDWFIKHRLIRSHKLITEEPFKSNTEPCKDVTFEGLITTSKTSNKQLIKFGKEIYI